MSLKTVMFDTARMLLVAAALLGTTGALAVSAARFYEEALTAFQRDDLPGAVAALRRALREDSSLLSAHVLAARVYLKAGEPGAAHESLDRAAQLGADPDIIMPLRAQVLFQQGKYATMRSLTPESLSARSRAIVHVYVGRSYLETGDFVGAEREFEQAAMLLPQKALPKISLATLALRQADLDRAEKLAQEAVSLEPQSADAWNSKADVLHARGDLQGALEGYQRALKLDPGHYDARLSRAGVLLELDRPREAAADVRIARTAKPLEPRAAYLEAIVRVREGQPASAREALGRADALMSQGGTVTPDHSMQMVYLAGMASFELGDLEQAEEHLERYLERYPRQVSARKLLGAVLLQGERSTEAIGVMEPALQTAGTDHRLLFLLGEAYTQAGRPDIAVRYLEQAVQRGSAEETLRVQLAVSRIAGGDEERGVQELRTLFQEDPEANYQVGLRLAGIELQRGRFDQATVVAERLLAINEKDVTVLELLGSARVEAGDLEMARRHFERALSLDPGFIPARLELARLAMRRGDLGAAREAFLEILEQQPDTVEAMLDLANIERQRGDSGNALRWLQKAQGADPASTSVALALVDLYLDTDEVTQAQLILQEAEGREPENQDVQAALARVHLHQGRTDLALGVYKRMVRLAGFDTRALYRTAVLQVAAGADAEAIYSLDKALKGDGGHLPSRLLLTRLQIRNGRLEQATENVRALSTTHPDLAEVHELKGDLFVAQGDARQALVSYRRALELGPGEDLALRVYRASLAAGLPERAEQFLGNWVDAHPDDLAARRTLAERYLSTGRLPQARRSYEAILQSAPGDTIVLTRLATILDRQGAAGALEYARQALAVAPADAEVLDTLGWLLVRSGEVDSGLRYLREAHSRASSDPGIRYHIAVALAKLDRVDEARDELRQALATGRSFEGSADARTLLNQLAR